MSTTAIADRIRGQLPDVAELDTPDSRDLLRVAVIGAAKRSAMPGGAFILDAPETVPAVWGEDAEVLWSQGEPLLLVGPTGTGKTTIAQNLTLARLGLRDAVIGYPVEPDDRRVLYLASDRPPQASRSFNRMVTETDRAVLDDRLVVWRGPLPHDLAKEPEILAVMAEHFDAGTIVADSLKDLAGKLSDDEVGQRVNLAMQNACLSGIDVVALHHQRKRQQGAAKPKTIDDVYGSTWITAGAGSVVLLWGEPGDAAIQLSHLKQPAEAVGPLNLIHDHDTGRTRAEDKVDLLEVVRTSKGLTVDGAARALYATDTPDRNQKETARRQLDRHVRAGRVHRDSTGTGRGNAARYYLTSSHEDAP